MKKSKKTTRIAGLQWEYDNLKTLKTSLGGWFHISVREIDSDIYEIHIPGEIQTVFKFSNIIFAAQWAAEKARDILLCALDEFPGSFCGEIE